MYEAAWLALFGAGTLTSAAAFYFKRAALYASVLNFGIWLIVGFGATNIIPSGGGPAQTALPLIPLAAGNALISLPVAYKAAFGDWGERETGVDSAGQDLPRPSTQPRAGDRQGAPEEGDRPRPVPPAARMGGSR